MGACSPGPVGATGLRLRDPMSRARAELAVMMPQERTSVPPARTHGSPPLPFLSLLWLWVPKFSAREQALFTSNSCPGANKVKAAGTSLQVREQGFQAPGR